MKDLLDIFLQPGPVLTKRYDKPDGWLPMLVLAIAGALFAHRYFSSVDAAWFMQETVERSGRELSQAQSDAIARSGGSPALVWTSTIGAIVGTVFYLVGWAVYFMLAGKFTGVAISFKQGLGLSGWASMPSLLGSLLALYGTAGMAPQTFISDLMLANFDPMLVQLPPESPWKALASSFSFLNLWVIGLAALGWRLWSRDAGWIKPVVVAALPFVLFYGYQAIKAITVST